MTSMTTNGSGDITNTSPICSISKNQEENKWCLNSQSNFFAIHRSLFSKDVNSLSDEKNWLKDLYKCHERTNTVGGPTW